MEKPGVFRSNSRVQVFLSFSARMVLGDSRNLCCHPGEAQGRLLEGEGTKPRGPQADSPAFQSLGRQAVDGPLRAVASNSGHRFPWPRALGFVFLFLGDTTAG